MIANFAVTYRCTSRCRTCNIWLMEDPERNELSLNEIQDIFESNKSILGNVKSIQLTGGEPFLRTDLPEIVAIIHRHLPKCTYWIPTNGMAPGRIEKATKEMLETLDGKGLGISVSIDGLRRTHETIRGVDGSFKKAIETLERLSSLRGMYPRLGLTVGMTLTPENFRELKGVFTIARRNGAEFSFRPVNFSDIYYRNVGASLPLGYVVDDILPTIRKIGHDIVERLGLWSSVPTLRYFQGAIDYIRSRGVRHLKCSAGSDSLFLDPYGNVYACIFLDEKMGNLRDNSFEEIWNSEEAAEARRRVRNGDCPGCWVECEVFRDIHKDWRRLASTALRAFLHPSTLSIS
jgi:MoaA/NifB/PqqE/SkfB family radical SAM enzyme